MPYATRLIGRRFGLLSVIAKTPERREKYIVWRCLCDCGQEILVTTHDLQSGRKKYCSRTQHPPIRKNKIRLDRRTYSTWRKMLRRCDSPHKPCYKGVRVCGRWREFNLFVADMGLRPQGAWTLDRIDNTKGYEPGNCRWASPRTQHKNRATSVFVEYKGEKWYLVELCEILGKKYSVVKGRLRSGWGIIDALEKPVRRHVKRTNALQSHR